MKLKIIAAATTGAIAPFIFTAQAYAIELCGASGSQFSALCALSSNDIGPTLGRAITAAFVFATVLALIYLIWGGIKWITSGGEKSGVEGARNHIIAAIIGLIVIFLSYFIINVILFFFTGTTLLQLTIPKLTP